MTPTYEHIAEMLAVLAMLVMLADVFWSVCTVLAVLAMRYLLILDVFWSTCTVLALLSAVLAGVAVLAVHVVGYLLILMFSGVLAQVGGGSRVGWGGYLLILDVFWRTYTVLAVLAVVLAVLAMLTMRYLLI